MRQASHRRSRVALLSLGALLPALGAAALLSRWADQSPSGIARRMAQVAPAGQPRLVSIDPLPRGDGAMCEWAPAQVGGAMLASLGEPPLASRALAEDTATAAAAKKLDQPPLRIIRDEYALYSAVAVDMARNEIIASDENLLRLMVYDRMANTPPAAAMTEPKRIIGGGTPSNPGDSVVEYPCGLYIDPKSGDIYSLSNDIGQTLSVFTRAAQGNAPAARTLRIPIGTFGIGVDEENQEMFVTVQHPAAVLVFRKLAAGKDAPLRILEGRRTLLADPHGVALDKTKSLLYVSNYGEVSYGKYPEGKMFGAMDRFAQQNGSIGWTIPDSGTLWAGLEPGSGRYFPPSISVYALNASGDGAPLRVIQGAKTQLNWPGHISLDAAHDELYVANDVGDSVLVFRASDSGNAAPVRVLKGPKTGLRNPTGLFVDTANQELVVANMGNHSITVYPRTAAGDSAPARVIRSGPSGSSGPMLVKPGAVSFDTRRQQILVPN